MGDNGRRNTSSSENSGDYEMSISNEQIAVMRASGQITDQEIAILEGDLIVAKNVVTEARESLVRQMMCWLNQHRKEFCEGKQNEVR